LLFPFGTAVFRTGVLPAFGFFGTGLRRTGVLFFCDDVVGFLAMRNAPLNVPVPGLSEPAACIKQLRVCAG
jgi:hypothetical protein